MKILVVENEASTSFSNDVLATLKTPPSMEDIARKHGVQLPVLEKELELGIKEEVEHTPDPMVARIIAAHHLDEDPTFYSQKKFKNSSARPRAFRARHLEPGPVRYEGMGPVDPKTGRRGDLTLILRKEAIDKMRNSARGIPVVNWAHSDVSPKDFANLKNAEGLKPDGIVTGGSWENDGWDWLDFLVWDKETIENCDRGFQVSCAYKPTEVDMTPGIYHNIPYDGEILNGEYEHLAVLPNPRYEKSKIICNSLGGKMNKFLLKLLGKTEPVEIEGAEVAMEDGTKVTLGTLVNSYKAVKAEEEKKSLENSVKDLKDDTIVTVGGREVTVKELKEAHAAMLLKNSAEDEAKAKAEAEAKAAEEAEAQAEKEKAEKEAEVLKNAQEAELKAKAEKEALDKKKADEEAQKNFEHLRNAANKTGDPVKLPAYESQDERLARGREMFGTEPTAKP